MKTKSDRLQRDIVLLTLSMFIIVAAWVGFNVHHSRVNSTIDDVLQTQIIPIPGNFDNATIQDLQSRTVIEPDYIHPVSSTAAQQGFSATPEEETPVLIIEPTATEEFLDPNATIQESFIPENGTPATSEQEGGTQ
jgi:hypothetical protein